MHSHVIKVIQSILHMRVNPEINIMIPLSHDIMSFRRLNLYLHVSVF